MLISQLKDIEKMGSDISLKSQLALGRNNLKIFRVSASPFTLSAFMNEFTDERFKR